MDEQETISAKELGKQMAAAAIEQVVEAITVLNLDQTDLLDFWQGFTQRVIEDE